MSFDGTEGGSNAGTNLKKIDNGGDVGRNLIEVVVVHPEVITADSGNVVGLAGMREGKVVLQSYS